MIFPVQMGETDTASAKNRSRGPEKSIWRTKRVFVSETLRNMPAYLMDLSIVPAVGAERKISFRINI